MKYTDEPPYPRYWRNYYEQGSSFFRVLERGGKVEFKWVTADGVSTYGDWITCYFLESDIEKNREYRYVPCDASTAGDTSDISIYPVYLKNKESQTQLYWRQLSKNDVVEIRSTNVKGWFPYNRSIGELIEQGHVSCMVVEAETQNAS